MRFFKFLLLIVSPIALYPGLYVTWIGGVTLVEETILRIQLREAKSWPTTEATIESAESKDPATPYPWPGRIHCRFRYIKDGREYTVEQNRFSSHHSFFSTTHDVFCARLVPRMGTPPKHRCHVNPEDPAEALLTATFDDAQLGVSLAAACFATLLGLAMLGVGGLFIGVLVIWAFPRAEKPGPATPPDRIDANVANGRVLLPLAAWFTLGVIPMALFTIPALLRGEATGDYWIPVVLQCALPLPFWFLGLRRRRSAPLVKDSWLALDGRPINLRSPPAGRLFLAPTTDCPAEVSIKYELIKSAGKNSSTFWKKKLTVPYERSSDGLGGGSYTLPPADVPVDVAKFGSIRMLWAITVKGRIRGRAFNMFFPRFL